MMYDGIKNGAVGYKYRFKELLLQEKSEVESDVSAQFAMDTFNNAKIEGAF